MEMDKRHKRRHCWDLQESFICIRANTEASITGVKKGIDFRESVCWTHTDQVKLSGS